jgi:Alpha/beta hydrolase
VTLTVADIDRWSAESVREVFHAANARGQATLEASRQLSSLAVFDSWEGATAEARKHTNASIRQDLDAHGNESLAVAKAAGKAADDIEHVQSELRTLRADASELHMTIDPVSNTIIPTSKALPTEIMMAEMQLQPRLDKILAEANAVDAELAAAINAAEGNTPVPDGPHDNRPEIRDALSRPLPDDPKQFGDLWSKLTPEEKDWLYSRDHNIGNHPGMPWDPSDPQDPNNFHLGRDHYNQLHLPELQANAQANVDRLQAQFDALARQAYMGDHDAAAQASALAPQLAAARHSLDGFKAVQADMNKSDGLKRYLGVIDDKGHAAVAIGNPDYATRNAIFVPGTGQDIARFDGSDAKSVAMYNAAHAADPRQTVAVTTWMGYDRPMDLTQAAWPDRAVSGGASLDAFQAGQRASHVGAPSIDTVIGHSYGSTVVGAAADGGNHLDANNVIGIGSPGMLAKHASDLNLDPGGNVFAMRAHNDIIEVVTDMTLGRDPTSADFGGIHLSAGPGPSTDPYGLLPSVAAHSSYWQPGNPALDNIGAVIDGLPPPQIIGPDGLVVQK